MWIVCGAGLHLGEEGAGGKGVEASMATLEGEINPGDEDRVFTSRPSGSQVGKGWRPASLARVALRRRSPLLTLLAQAGSASSGPTTSHRHAPTARTTASELLASTAPGRPEAAAVPPDATAARRGGPDLVCSQWESGGLQDLSSLAGQSEGRGLGRAGCWSGGECFRG